MTNYPVNVGFTLNVYSLCVAPKVVSTDGEGPVVRVMNKEGPTTSKTGKRSSGKGVGRNRASSNGEASFRKDEVTTLASAYAHFRSLPSTRNRPGARGQELSHDLQPLPTQLQPTAQSQHGLLACGMVVKVIKYIAKHRSGAEALLRVNTDVSVVLVLFRIARRSVAEEEWKLFKRTYRCVHQ